MNNQNKSADFEQGTSNFVCPKQGSGIKSGKQANAVQTQSFDAKPAKQIAAGIIVNNGKVLLGQRRRGKDLEFFWELPGGKLEQGETLEECLRRELLEEMDLEIQVGKFFMQSSFDYTFGTFVINAFLADCAQTEIGKICEHEQYQWVEPKNLLNYQMSPADIPIIEAYIKFISEADETSNS